MVLLGFYDENGNKLFVSIEENWSVTIIMQNFYDEKASE